MSASTSTVSSALIESLRRIVGLDGVISNRDELLVYECDAFTMEKNLPNVVVLPRSTEQVVAVVKLCARHNVPIIPRVAGTSLCRVALPLRRFVSNFGRPSK